MEKAPASIVSICHRKLNYDSIEKEDAGILWASLRLANGSPEERLVLAHGLVQVVLYIGVFYQARVDSDLILHVIYVIMQVYGWYHWLHGGRERTELKVTTLSVTALLAWILIGAAATIPWGYSMATYTDAAAPYADAFIAATSLIAQWLMARKNWNPGSSGSPLTSLPSPSTSTKNFTLRPGFTRCFSSSPSWAISNGGRPFNPRAFLPLPKRERHYEWHDHRADSREAFPSRCTKDISLSSIRPWPKPTTFSC